MKFFDGSLDLLTLKIQLALGLDLLYWRRDFY